MLELKNITKDYFIDKQPVPALRGINLAFQNKGFVSILGPSGCGKTTLLNIIGGLDHYSSGDLLIDGKSTKEFKDKDWDAYRNVHVGFVFQTYNLIPHMSVLANVETALLLNGVRRAERKEKALEALRSVGLENEAKKKPNQLSGGQMQRVALARALVNEPEIILADEPTGALDSNTSIQVMEILKKVSAERLVIMVTHNKELAEWYSDRIITMKDGEIINDSAQFIYESSQKPVIHEKQKTSMSYMTALKSSLGNIRTKKTRTILTAVASSIGIIGVALVLSVSNGFKKYVDDVERSVASAVPITVMPTTYTYQSNKGAINEQYPDEEVVKVYEDSTSSILSVHQNKFTQEYYEYLNALTTDKDKKEWVNSVLFNRLNQDFHLLTDVGDYIMQPNQYKSASTLSGMVGSVAGLPTYIFHELYYENDKLSDWYDVLKGRMPTKKDEIVLLLDSRNQVDYSTLYNLGFIDPSETIHAKEISFDDIIGKTYKVYRSVDWYRNDEYKTINKKVWEVDRFNQDTFQLEAHEAYQEVHYFQRSHGFGEVYSRDDLYNPLELKIVGILRPTRNTYINLMPPSLAYTTELKDYITTDGLDETDPLKKAENIALDKKVKDAASSNVFLSAPDSYSSNDGLSKLNSYFLEANALAKGETKTLQDILNLIKEGKTDDLDETDLAKVSTAISGFTNILDSALSFTSYWAEKGNNTPDFVSRSNFLKNAQKVGANLGQENININTSVEGLLASILKYGGVDGFFENAPRDFFNTMADLDRTNGSAIDYVALINQFSVITSISIFPSSLTVKDKLVDYLNAYNHYGYKLENDLRPEDEQIYFTDLMGTFTDTIAILIKVISVVLIVFASISLLVSSIMTGIITYVSVVERTKEIGILRACGARKKDVGRLFEAECVIIGALAGLIGVLVTLVVDIPLGLIIDHFFPGYNLRSIASLNPLHAVLLLVLAVILAFISGLVPARIAANKDPVTALRTE